LSLGQTLQLEHGVETETIKNGDDIDDRVVNIISYDITDRVVDKYNITNTVLFVTLIVLTFLVKGLVNIVYNQSVIIQRIIDT